MEFEEIFASVERERGGGALNVLGYVLGMFPTCEKKHGNAFGWRCPYCTVPYRIVLYRVPAHQYLGGRGV